MQEHHSTSPTVTRIVIVLAIVSLIGFAGFGVLHWKAERIPVLWYQESFGFDDSKSHCVAYCVVFLEPKLVFFLGDGGTDEVFNRIGSHSSFSGITVNGYGVGTSSGSSEGFSFKTQPGKMTMRLLDGKHEMVVSRSGRKLILNDGRKFTLDGRTPLWLRCKSDGTIVELEELPEGFVEFFESPPANPGLIGSVKSWPEAFRK